MTQDDITSIQKAIDYAAKVLLLPHSLPKSLDRILQRLCELETELQEAQSENEKIKDHAEKIKAFADARDDSYQDAIRARDEEIHKQQELLKAANNALLRKDWEMEIQGRHIKYLEDRLNASLNAIQSQQHKPTKENPEKEAEINAVIEAYKQMAKESGY